MMSNQDFYTKFMQSILGVVGDVNHDDNTGDRVRFQMHQYKMIPARYMELFSNLNKSPSRLGKGA